MTSRSPGSRKGSKKKSQGSAVPWGGVIAGGLFVVIAGLVTWLVLRPGNPTEPFAADAPPAVVESATPSPSPVAPVPTRPVTSANERSAAEKFLEIGASLVIADSTGSPLFVTHLNQLPEALQITGLLLDDCQKLTPEHASMITRLGGLSDLQLARAKITDEWLAELAPLSSLASLNIEDTALTSKSLPVIAKWTSLSFLALTLDLSDKEMAGLTTLSKLRQLRCVGSKATNVGLQAICTACPDLTHFVTDQLAITDAGLEAVSRLTKLRLLGLMRAPVTDGGVPIFRQFKTLTHLLIPGTQVTRQGTTQIRDALPNCQVFGGKYDPRRVIAARVLASGGQVTIQVNGHEPRTITLLDDLPEEEFSCSEISLAGAKPTEEWLLGDLLLNDTHRLNLKGAQFDVRHLADIPLRCPHLKHLDLSGTRTGDVLVKPLSQLRELLTIDVSQTPLTANGVVDLRMGLPEGVDVVDGTPYDIEQDRRVAEAVIKLGQTVHIIEPGGKKSVVTTLDQLPTGRFWVREVYMVSCPEVNDAWLDQLAGLQGLRSIMTHSCSLGDQSLRKLVMCPTLQSIHLSWQGRLFSDEMPISLTSWRHLSDFGVEGAWDASSVGIRKLGPHPNLKHIIVASGDKTGNRESIPLIAQQFPNLEILTFWGGEIDDQAAESLYSINGLTYLDIYGSRGMTSSGVRRLLQLPTLWNLTLGKSALDSETLTKLFQHSHLRHVNLSGCDFAEKDFEQLLNMECSTVSITVNPEVVSFRLAKQIHAKHPHLTIDRGDGPRRQVARQMLDCGATISLKVKGETKLTVLKKEDSLPEEDFETIKINMTGVPFPSFTSFFHHNFGTLSLEEAILTDSSAPGNLIMGLHGFQKLTKLEVAGLEVTDVHIDRMPTLPNLKTLDLRRTQVTAEAVIRLAQRMPACQIGVDDEVLTKIKRLQKAAK